jgi:hypothetical protein
MGRLAWRGRWSLSGNGRDRPAVHTRAVCNTVYTQSGGGGGTGIQATVDTFNVKVGSMCVWFKLRRGALELGATAATRPCQHAGTKHGATWQEALLQSPS